MILALLKWVLSAEVKKKKVNKNIKLGQNKQHCRERLSANQAAASAGAQTCHFLSGRIKASMIS